MLDERGEPVGLSLGLDVDTEDPLLESSHELTDRVACGRGPLGEDSGAPQRVAASARPEQGVHELYLQGDVELGRGYEHGGPLEQADGGPLVTSEPRPPPGRGQATPRCRSQFVVGVQAELIAVAPGLLEVVAEKLVQLDQSGAVLL